jgi:hypothetical protein
LSECISTSAAGRRPLRKDLTLPNKLTPRFRVDFFDL